MTEGARGDLATTARLAWQQAHPSPPPDHGDACWCAECDPGRPTGQGASPDGPENDGHYHPPTPGRARPGLTPAQAEAIDAAPPGGVPRQD